jgi:hypothetical protein
MFSSEINIFLDIFVVAPCVPFGFALNSPLRQVEQKSLVYDQELLPVIISTKHQRI